jgi:hypothetical protein
MPVTVPAAVEVPVDKSAAHAKIVAARADARQERHHAKDVAKLNKGFDAAHAQWQSNLSDLEEMLAQAQQFHGDSSSEILLKSGERQYVAIAGSVVEDRAGQRTFVGGSQGVSIPIGSIGGRSVRYRVGRMKGHVVQAPPVATAIDQGRIIVTNQRVVFQGIKQTRECLFAKLVGFEHIDVGDTVVSVSNRQKPTRLRYAPTDSNWFQFGLTLAIADNRGQTLEFVEQLSSKVDEQRMAEPQPAA